MDNRQFNVNGKGEEDLLATLELVFKQEGKNTTCKAWKITKKHGLILAWHKDDRFTGLPAGMSAKTILPLVTSYLESPEAADVELTDWDENEDHDGSNSKGWRVYCEDWGHVDGCFYAICAIKSVYLWHGK